MASVSLLAAALASYAGFACLALAMPRHWSSASGRRAGASPYRSSLRTCGALLLLLSLALCVYRDGAAFGAVLWTVLISFAAVGVALTLAWRPRWLLPGAHVFSDRTGVNL